MDLSQLIGFQKKCLQMSVPFVTYQLPGTDVPVTIADNLKSQVVHDINPFLAEGKGFLFAPFSKTQPMIWLNADHLYYGNEISDLKSYQSIKQPEPADALPFPVSKEQYLKQVEAIQESIKKGHISKAVLSRVIRIPFERDNNAPELFRLLVSKFTSAFVYLIYLPGIGCWTGASPELLILAQFNDESNTSAKMASLKTMALAGTRTKGDPGNWGVKEIDEHNWVSGYIKQSLIDTGCTSIEQSELVTSPAGNVEHLRTDFKAKIKTEKLNTLLNALHPTPAVCGWPTAEALNLIYSVEKHERSFYTGYLGPVNISGNTSMFVNLRCMQMAAHEAVIYAGGGITAGSIAEDEWEETTIKSRTLLTEIEKIRT